MLGRTLHVSLLNECFKFVVIKVSPCVEYQPCVLCCGGYAHQFHHHCISVPRIIAEIVQLGLQQKQLGRTSVLEFSGMLTLELDLGSNTNVGAHEILHLLTKNGSFYY
jgi:hypothetical protein